MPMILALRLKLHWFDLFSLLGKLAGRAIYFADEFSLFFIFIFFLMADFLDLIAQILMDQSSPKFQDW